MTTEVGHAAVSLFPSAKGFGPKLQSEVGPQIDKAGKETGGRFSKGILGGLGGLKAGIAGAFAGVAVGSFLKGAVDAASDLSESQSKVNVVFGKSSDQVLKFADNAAKAMGQSRGQALEAAGGLGNLLVALKLPQAQAATLSTKMVGLAGDLASFNNVAPEEALLALRSGLSGETEPLKRFGVNINDAQLKAQALKDGLIKSVKDGLTPQQKALAATALIFDQTKTAQGDFARTSGGLANQQRILSAQFDDVKAKVGAGLLPVMTSLATFANTTLIPAISRLGNFLSTTLGPVFTQIKYAVVALVAAFHDGDVTSNGLVGAFERVGVFAKEQVVPAVRLIVQHIRANVIPTFRALASFIGTNVVPVLRSLAGFIVSTVIPAAVRIGGIVAGTLQRGFATLSKKIAENRPQLIQIGNVLRTVAGFIVSNVLPVVARLASFIAGTLFNAIGKGIGIIGGIVRAIAAVVDKVREAIDFFGRLADKIKNLPGVDKLGKIASLAGKIPGFAGGGTLPPGFSVTGERGPELVYSPRGGERVYSNAQSRDLLAAAPAGGGTEVNMPVQIYGTDDIIERALRRTRRDLAFALATGP